MFSTIWLNPKKNLIDDEITYRIRSSDLCIAEKNEIVNKNIPSI